MRPRGKALRCGGLALLLVLAQVSTSALTPAVASAASLSDALVGAYRSSHLLEQNRALLRARDEGVAKAVSALRPAIAFVSQSTVSDPTPFTNSFISSLSLTASYLLYDFGGSAARAEAAREAVRSARASLVNVEQQVLLSAVTAYMTLRKDIQSVGISENNVRVLAKELSAARDRFDVGEVTRTDVSQAQAFLAAARSSLAAARGQLEITRASYIAVVGARPGSTVAPPPPPKLPGGLSAAQALARVTHPSIRAAQHNVKAAELALEAARDALRPRISLSAQYARRGTSGLGGASDASSIGLSVQIPIYQGGELLSGIRAQQANLDAARAALAQAAVTVNQKVADAWAQLAIARAQIRASKQQVSAAKTAFEGVREEARLGSRTTLDVLNTEQNLLAARNNLVAANASAYVASYGLLAAIGLLTVKHLGLGIKTYDPAQNYDAVKSAPALSLRGRRLDRILRLRGKN